MSASHPPGPSGWIRPAVLGSVGTTAVILPAFLTGAVAVQLRHELGLTETAVGAAISAFFLGSTLGSSPLGRLAERLGAESALRLGLAVTVVADLLVVLTARGTWSLAGALFLAGGSNALAQPAINLHVVRSVVPGRLGLVMALKQSGMPAAALLGGLAVPTLALTIGWRAAFVVGAALAMVSMALIGPGRTAPRAGRGAIGRAGDRVRPDQGWPVLAVMAGVGVLGGGSANIVVGHLVSGAAASGIEPGRAGLVLTGGSALGIVSRLVHGWLSDRAAIVALDRVVLLLASGTVGTMILAVDRPIGYLVATPLVFAGGWAWPGLFNLVVVETNRSAPAAATGVTQTGVYLGSVIGPVLAGSMIERSGYRAAWLLTAGCLAGAAVATAAVRSLVARVE